jgi:hypothetical protein
VGGGGLYLHSPIRLHSVTGKLYLYYFIIPATTMFRMALGPTQPPIQWVPGAFSLGVKQPGCEVDHSPLSSAKAKECIELYTHSPNMPSWRGAQLKRTAQGQLYFCLYYLL